MTRVVADFIPHMGNFIPCMGNVFPHMGNIARVNALICPNFGD